MDRPERTFDAGAWACINPSGMISYALRGRFAESYFVCTPDDLRIKAKEMLECAAWAESQASQQRGTSSKEQD